LDLDFYFIYCNSFINIGLVFVITLIGHKVNQVQRIWDTCVEYWRD